MSRGPGRVERIIAAAFTDNPSETFTIEELAQLAFPGVNRVEKKHRVAVRRAAYAVAKRLEWDAYVSQRPGGHIVFCNPFDVRSYAIGRHRADFLSYAMTVREIKAELAAPGRHRTSFYDLVQPGGAWVKHVEIRRLRRAGDDAGADAVMGEIEASVARSMSGIPAI